ncbi:MAG: adenylate kinase [Pirellulaceae bacterium]|nr:adenylate kinase [Pirellulaceae bacterium]
MTADYSSHDSRADCWTNLATPQAGGGVSERGCHAACFHRPPGAGKGTQCQRLLAYLGIPHLSTGALLRAAKTADSQVGRLAAQYMDGGRLVPDPLVLEMVGEKLGQPQYADGCLFDGFPRTIQQAQSLDETLAARGTPLTMALELKCDETELIGRMLKRAAAEKRVDDNPQTIAERLNVYKRQTAPLLDYYRKQGLLVSIDGMGSPDEVFSRIQAAVDSRRDEARRDTPTKPH